MVMLCQVAAGMAACPGLHTTGHRRRTGVKSRASRSYLFTLVSKLWDRTQRLKRSTRTNVSVTSCRLQQCAVAVTQADLRDVVPVRSLTRTWRIRHAKHSLSGAANATPGQQREVLLSYDNSTHLEHIRAEGVDRADGRINSSCPNAVRIDSCTSSTRNCRKSHRRVVFCRARWPLEEDDCCRQASDNPKDTRADAGGGATTAVWPS